MADDVHQGAFVTAATDWILDNFHVVASEIRDVRQNLPARLLPRAAQARPARAGGNGARVRDGGRDHPPQRQPPGPGQARALHEQLPDGGPADHRRAVGLAQHAQAGPDREPAAPGRQDPGEPRRAPGRRRLRGPDRQRRPRSGASAADRAPHRVRRPGPAAHPRVRAAPGRGTHGGGGAPRRPADDLGRRDPQRAPGPGRGPGLGGERDHEPAPVLDPGLEPVLRIGEPRRARAPAGSRGPLRRNGLPEP